MEIEIKKVTDLIPYINNARTHTDEQVLQIAASIKEFGFNNPILLDGDNGVIAGHGRLQAAKKLNINDVPTICLDHLSEVQRKAYILADNRLAENAGWDTDLLSLELTDLMDLDFDIEIAGFDIDDIKLDENEGLTDEDAVPDVPDEPISKLGDVWILGNHRLMCGDSTSIDDVEKLMDGHKADMVFTDPPYGVDYSGGVQYKNGKEIRGARTKLKNDDNTNIYTNVIPVINMFLNGAAYIWFSDITACSIYNALNNNKFDIHASIIWKKNGGYSALNANYKPNHESCLYVKQKGNKLNFCGATNETTIWEINKDGRNKLHPTQKPVELAEKAILNHSAGLIMDLFGGSGSTLIACEKTNRNCRMMELDQKYIDVIIKRWQEFTGNSAVLELNGKLFNELEKQ